MKVSKSHSSNTLNISFQGMSLPERVLIYDCTLRDGEQTPGVALTIKEKVAIAKQLAKLGVDTIEAGFPVNSRDEKEAVKQIAKEVTQVPISGLARVVREDLDACLDCDVDIVHTFVSTSDIHLEHQMRKSREDILKAAVDSVEYVKKHGVKCQFSAMDATRTDLNYLLEVFRAVEDAGVDAIDVADTVGLMIPSAMRAFMAKIRKSVGVTLDVHCHNDYGMGVANTLAAVEAGANEVHVTINGIGERAGNTALEPVVLALMSIYNKDINVNPKYLMETSQLVERYTGVSVSPCTPIIGAHAFAHESGIHVSAIIREASTFEPIKPEDVGQRRRLVIGKHTGKASVKNALTELGVTNVSDEELVQITIRVKDLAGQNKIVSDVDLLAIAEDVAKAKAYEPYIELKEFLVTSGKGITPSALVRMKMGDAEKVGQGTGVGPFDAAANAIEDIVGPIAHLRLKEYNLKALTGGTDSLGAVKITVEDRRRNSFEAEAIHQDIVMASVNAFVQALNKAMHANHKLV